VSVTGWPAGHAHRRREGARPADRRAIHQRNKDVSDLTRRQKFGRTRAKVFNDYGAWLCEDGAGEIPLMNQQGGFWNTQRIAAAPKGTIERISLAFGTGLTEHLLNVNLSSNPAPRRSLARPAAATSSRRSRSPRISSRTCPARHAAYRHG
jgi:hypothetical protein